MVKRSRPRKTGVDGPVVWLFDVDTGRLSRNGLRILASEARGGTDRRPVPLLKSASRCMSDRRSPIYTVVHVRPRAKGERPASIGTAASTRHPRFRSLEAGTTLARVSATRPVRN